LLVISCTTIATATTTAATLVSKGRAHKMNLNTAYEILGMTRSSSEEEIKRAYKELALKTHPGIHFLPYLY